jgi:hypothetical protein
LEIEVKKLLAMILMLGIALPALATEVKLLCVSGDRKRIVTFDEEAKTVNGHAVGDGGIRIGDHYVLFTEGEGGGKWYELDQVDRYDGSYYWESSSGFGEGSKSGHGTCTQAKKAF